MIIGLLVNLLVVLGLIGIAAYVVHFINKRKQKNNPDIELTCTLPLGSKEKLIIVKARGEHLLLGVTQQQISLLSKLQTADENAFDELLKSAESYQLQSVNKLP